MKIIKDLFKFDRQLLGGGYDQALEYIHNILYLDILEFKSGTKLETWEVPNEWRVKEAWVKFNGKKIIDYKENPMSLMQYSRPFKGKITRDEFKRHLNYSNERPNAIPYTYTFYEDNWGFNYPKSKIYKEDDKLADLLEEGEYEVCIDTEFVPGIMKLGVHTIKGKSDREVLLLAHLDHPWQANDNLSGVACLIDLAGKIRCKHTIKIVFCPETIGSIAYAMTQDISKVDFAISVDICGNNNDITGQWCFEEENKLNKILDSALSMGDESYRLNRFRAEIGSDEYVFNDPKIGIPGLLLTRYPYYEYHTSDDTPEIINEDKIKKTGEVIQRIIEIYEKDYIPDRTFKGPLMRSNYKTQTPIKSINLQLDYFIYNVNGKLWLSEIANLLQMNFNYCYELLKKLRKDNLIYDKNMRSDARQKREWKTKE
jgi:aminopeptidase-like protein